MPIAMPTPLGSPMCPSHETERFPKVQVSLKDKRIEMCEILGKQHYYRTYSPYCKFKLKAAETKELKEVYEEREERAREERKARRKQKSTRDPGVAGLSRARARKATATMHRMMNECAPYRPTRAHLQIDEVPLESAFFRNSHMYATIQQHETHYWIMRVYDHNHKTLAIYNQVTAAEKAALFRFCWEIYHNSYYVDKEYCHSAQELYEDLLKNGYQQTSRRFS